MFDLLEILDLKPEAPEYGESTAEIIQNRSLDVGGSLEAVGLAISAMLGGVQERVETFTHQTDVVLSPQVVALSQEASRIHDENEATVRRMALGNDLGFNPGAPEDTAQIVAKNDDMANAISMEDAREQLSQVFAGTKVPFEPLATEPLKPVGQDRIYTPEEQQRIAELESQVASMHATNDQFAKA